MELSGKPAENHPTTTWQPKPPSGFRSALATTLCRLVSICWLLGATGCDPESVSRLSEEGEGKVTAVGVLGDSDSHGYRDTMLLGPGGRGAGEYPPPLQWTEIWDHLRGHQISLGPRGRWGTSRRVARVMGWMGLSTRAPCKLDHRNNLAFSGARCRSLNHGHDEQVGALLDIMRRRPSAWHGGIVVIRIGVNDFGQPVHLDRLLQPDEADGILRSIHSCVREIETAVHRIRRVGPEVTVVLIGVFNNVHWPQALERWRDAEELLVIEESLDRFDDGLRRIAAENPGVLFHDDRAWFRALWGGRDGQGNPDYTSVSIGSIQVSNTAGDAPENVVLGDGHFGTLANGVWLNSLIQLILRETSIPLTPLGSVELEGLVDPIKN